MVASGRRIIAGDALNLVVVLSSSTPTHGHTLVIYTYSCVQGISATLCEENIMFWEVSGIGTEVIISRVISFSDCTL